MNRPITILSRSALAGICVLVLGTVGCTNDQEQTVHIILPVDGGVAVAAQGPIDQAGGATLAIRRAGAFVSYLVDGQGRALYLFTADAEVEGSACDEECAEEWLPYVTYGEPRAAEPAVDEILIGTIARADDVVQVTYDGAPLYRFASDDQPGETSGHGLESHGGEWLLVSPEGEPVEAGVDGY